MTWSNKFLVIGIIMLIVGALFGIGMIVYINLPKNSSSQSTLKPSWLEQRGLNLTDNTQSVNNNICTATNLNMKVTIDPCNAVTMSGRVTQFVNFTWNGASSLKTSWVFMFTKDLKDAKIELIKSVNKTIVQQEVRNIINETLGTYNSIWTNVTRYDVNYQDVTAQFQSLGKDIIIKGSYYKVSDYQFSPGETVPLRVTYTPSESNGKWFIFGYPSAKSIQQSVLDNTYLYVDPTWNSTFNQGLVSYYPMNDTSTIANFTDIISANNATNMGSLTYSTPGILGTSIKFNGGTGRATPKTLGISNNATWSWNGWINCSPQSDDRFWAENDQVQAFVGLGTGSSATAALKFFIRNNAGGILLNTEVTSAIVCYNNWSMLTLVKNGTGNYEVFVNGTLIVSGTFTDFSSPMNFTNSTFGAHSIGGGGSFLTGYMDEIGIWNRTLTASEVSDLYNGGGGLLWKSDSTVTPDTTPPNITLKAPADGSTVTAEYATFNATFNDNVNVTNATFFMWNASSKALVNQTQITLGKGAYESANLTVYFPYNGTFYWNYRATDNSSNWAFNLTNFTITYSAPIGDITPPIYGAQNVTPSSPTTYVLMQNYSFNISWSNLNGTGTIILRFNGTNYTASNESGNYNVSIMDLPAGNYSYWWWANDSSGNGNSTDTFSYNITKASVSLSITITPSDTVFNGTETTTTGLGCPSFLTCNLYVNDTPVVNPHIVTFGNDGIFMYVYNTTGNNNYSSTSATRALIETNEPDTTPPNVNITYPINGSVVSYYISGMNITLNYTINDTLPQTCWYAYNLSTYCYQEFANVSTICGGSENGTYSMFDGTFEDESKIYDGDWKTATNKTTADPGSAQININYTIPTGATNTSMITYRNANGDYVNLTVFSGCWNNSGKIVLRSRVITTPGGNLSEFSCQISSGAWLDINQAPAPAGTSMYEEAMIWNMSTFKDSLEHNFISCSANTTSFNPQSNTVYLFANDTAGNIAYTSSTWSYGILENNQYYNNVTFETSNENYLLNITYSPGWSGIITLNYNGTLYSSSAISDGINSIYSANVNIPLIYKSVDTKNMHWEIQASNGLNNYYFNSTNKYQSINEILFTKCNATYASPVFVNYSILDENTLALITPGLYQNNFIATFNYNLGGTEFKNTTFSNPTGLNNYTFCTNINRTFIVSPYISLTYPGYASRNFEILLDSYSNSSITERKLYLLNSGNATAVIIRVKNSSNLPAPDIYTNIYRYYPSTDTYLLVENGRTDLYGQFVSELIQNTVRYKFVFKDAAGNILKTSDKVTVACLSSICILPFVIEDTTDDFGQFKNTSGNSWNFYFNNNTNTYIYTWNDVSGNNATKVLSVQRVQANGTTTPCNVTTTNSSGTISCYVGNISASYIAQAYYNTVTINKRLGLLNNEIGTSYPTGTEGLIWSIFILMTCIAFGYWKPTIGFVLYGAVSGLLYFIHVLQLNPAILVAEWIVVGIFVWAFRG